MHRIALRTLCNASRESSNSKALRKASVDGGVTNGNESIIPTPSHFNCSTTCREKGSSSQKLTLLIVALLLLA